MSLDRAEVAHLAQLARIGVTPAELDLFASQLDVILDAVARVGEVAAAEVPGTSHPLALVNVTRPDEPRTGAAVEREEVLAAAPAAEQGRFRVPRILDEEG